MILFRLVKIWIIIEVTIFCFCINVYAEHNGVTLPPEHVVFMKKYASVGHVYAVDLNDQSRKSNEAFHILEMASPHYHDLRDAKIIAVKDHEELEWAPDKPEWSGLVYAKGISEVLVSTYQSGNEYADPGLEYAKIVILDGTRNTLTLHGNDFQKARTILLNIATSIGGSSDDVTADVTGVWSWYKVDKKNSPYCDTSYELSAGGDFALSHKFYITALGVDLKYVKLGVFVEPEVELALNGIAIKLDGSQNPRQFSELGGNAEIKGSISGGVGVEARIPDVIDIEIDAKGTAAAGGFFGVTVPGPMLSGEYSIGQLNVSGTVSVAFRGTDIIDIEIEKKLFDGYTRRGEISLAQFFSGK